MKKQPTLLPDEPRSIGQQVADVITNFAGSWTFIIIFLSCLVIWMFINSKYFEHKSFDPYPFILLNLVLSCLAAIQAPVILMSQNRQSTKDSHISLQDYLVDLEAKEKVHEIKEMVIQLEKKIDKLNQK